MVIRAVSVPRQLALTKKVSLAEFADGWDDCYAVVRLADFAEFRETASQNWEHQKRIEIIDYEIQFVKRHFVEGKVLVLNPETNKPEMQDMLPDDVAAWPDLADKLYATIMGVTLDPKGSGRAAGRDTTPSAPESNTKTT